MITQDAIKSLLNYNPETGEFSIINDGHMRKSGDNPCYEKRGKGRKKKLSISINGKSFYAHKLAILYETGVYPKFVDAIDGDYTNIRISNLRDKSKLSRSELTTDVVRSIIDYDKDTGVFRWNKSRGGKLAGEVAGTVVKNKSGKSYIEILFCGVSFKAHRLAFLWMGEDLPEQVDHDDGNGTNNSWSNLNRSDKYGNAKNQRLKSTNTTGIFGITFDNSSGVWRARISNFGKRIHLGRFNNFFDACCARKSAEVKLGYHQSHGSIRPLY